MATFKIPCPKCERVTPVDESKLPDQPVSFKCPGCSAKVRVDKRELKKAAAAGEPMPVEAPEPPRAGPPPPSASDAPKEASAPRLAACAEVASTGGGLFSKSLPEGTELPSGFVIEMGGPTAGEIAALLEPYQSKVHAASVEDIIELSKSDPPELVIVSAAQAGAPPSQALGSLRGFPPNLRRRVFVVLIAPDAKTLDGNSAFFHQVNLLVSSREINKLPSVLWEGLRYHRRFYATFLKYLEEFGKL